LFQALPRARLVVAFFCLASACTQEPAASSSSSSGSQGETSSSRPVANSSAGGSSAHSHGSGSGSAFSSEGSGASASGLSGGVSSSVGSGSSTSRPDVCDYLDLDIFIVQCGPEADPVFAYLRRWTDLNSNATCADYWTLRTGEYASDAEALSAQGCSTQCRWAASTSVSYLHCGVRSGYIIYTSNNCADVYEYDDGIYRSAEDYEREHPCP
jgi:hypothetical protein